MNYANIANAAALSSGPLLQIPNELLPFMEFLDKNVQPKNILELGLCQGATFFIWCHMAVPGGIKLAIDLPNGPWGSKTTRTDKEIAANLHKFQTFAPNSHVLFADTKEKTSVEWVKTKLTGQQLDFLFIDADHSYEGVKSDYEKYAPFVRKGGCIAIHDIKNTPQHRDMDCFVSKFWQELPGQKMEFIDEQYAWGGIGAVIV